MWIFITEKLNVFDDYLNNNYNKKKPENHHSSGRPKVADLPSSFNADIVNYWEFLQVVSKSRNIIFIYHNCAKYGILYPEVKPYPNPDEIFMFL